MRFRFLIIAIIGLLTAPTFAATQGQIILPNGQNCALPATIDKAMRSLCHTLAQRKAEQSSDAASAAKSAAEIAPVAGDSVTKAKKRHHKKKPETVRPIQ